MSQFKATCLRVLDEVQKTRHPVRITRRGKPVEEIVPASQAVSTKSSGCLGSVKGQVEILADIVAPASDENDGEAQQDWPSQK